MILIELQQSGLASFDELTELDELVNRDPKLRHIILEEMEETDMPANTPGKEIIHILQPKPQSLIEKIHSFIKSFHLLYKSAPALLG